MELAHPLAGAGPQGRARLARELLGGDAAAGRGTPVVACVAGAPVVGFVLPGSDTCFKISGYITGQVISINGGMI